jgi:hypothetical protein
VWCWCAPARRAALSPALTACLPCPPPLRHLGPRLSRFLGHSTSALPGRFAPPTGHPMARSTCLRAWPPVSDQSSNDSNRRGEGHASQTWALADYLWGHPDTLRHLSSGRAARVVSPRRPPADGRPAQPKPGGSPVVHPLASGGHLCTTRARARLHLGLLLSDSPLRQTNSFIENSIEAGILLGGNGIPLTLRRPARVGPAVGGHRPAPGYARRQQLTRPSDSPPCCDGIADVTPQTSAACAAATDRRPPLSNHQGPLPATAKLTGPGPPGCTSTDRGIMILLQNPIMILLQIYPKVYSTPTSINPTPTPNPA